MRHTSRPRRAAFILSTLAFLALWAVPAYAAAPEAPAWSPKLAYVLTTGEVRARLVAQLRLDAKKAARVREIGWQLYWQQRGIQKRSDLIVMNDALSLQEKQALIGSMGYNESLQSAEESAAAHVSEAIGMSDPAFVRTVDQVWKLDAATHNLETALNDMGVTAAAAAGVGSFRVYGTWFETDQGVALPDKYLKFATLGYANSGSTARPSGYPAGAYKVTLHWDGIHHGIGNNLNQVINNGRTVEGVSILDVGPWNTDDNWWNGYTDPARPRRINSAGVTTSDGVYHDIAGPNNLVGKTHLAYGLPEAQAAYFNYYGRPARIPAHTTNPENYWDKPRGYNGQWSGADQFNRQVLNPAGVDLGTVPARALTLTDNAWIDVTPLWEARLVLVGGISVTPGPYLTGQKVWFSAVVKNTGTLPAAWDTAEFTLKCGDGKFRNAPALHSVLVAPGQTRTLNFYRILDYAGTWTGSLSAHRAGVWAQVGTAGVSFTAAQRTIGRVQGADRYASAVAFSKKAYPGTNPVVVIASGGAFPDGLAGTVLAGAENAPLLLVDKTVPAVVDAELQRLKPTRIYVIGGPSVIPTAVADHLGAGGAIVVTRLWGHDRFETAREVAKSVRAAKGGAIPDATAFIATGRNFPDALAASPVAAKKGWPILLVEQGSIPTATAGSLEELGITRTFVVGANTVVSDAVLAKLPTPHRIKGATRYDTAADLADFAEANKILGYSYVGVASGTNFPDALVGGVYAATRGGVMLLTAGRLPAAPAHRFAAHRTVTANVDLYGSSAAVSDLVHYDVSVALW